MRPSNKILAKTASYIKKALVVKATLLTTYTSLLLGSQLVSRHFSPSINTQSQLEFILEEEKEKAGIPKTTKVSANIENERLVYSHKEGDKKYKVVLAKENSQLVLLRHELYHIADGHCDQPYYFLRYFFWEEPQATIYSITGLKP